MVLSSWSRGDWGCGGILSDGEGRGDASADGWSADERFLRRPSGIAGTFCTQGTKYVPKIKKAQAGAGAFLFSEYQIHEDNRRGVRALFLDAYQ